MLAFEWVISTLLIGKIFVKSMMILGGYDYVLKVMGTSMGDIGICDRWILYLIDDDIG